MFLQSIHLQVLKTYEYTKVWKIYAEWENISDKPKENTSQEESDTKTLSSTLLFYNR